MGIRDKPIAPASPVVATLEDLDEVALKRILTEPKNALVKQYQRLFEMESVDLTLADEALGAISKKAMERKTGARGLRSIMEGILLDTPRDDDLAQPHHVFALHCLTNHGERILPNLVFGGQVIGVVEVTLIYFRAGNELLDVDGVGAFQGEAVKFIVLHGQKAGADLLGLIKGY